MKQTWPELKAQAHRTPSCISQGRKEEQTHELPVLFHNASSSKPLCPWFLGRNAKYLRIPHGYNGKWIHRHDCTGLLFAALGGSHPHPHHSVESLLPELSLPSTVKENEANTTPQHHPALFHPCRSCVPSGQSQGRALGGPWDPSSTLKEPPPGTSSRAEPEVSACGHLASTGGKALTKQPITQPRFAEKGTT